MTQLTEVMDYVTREVDNNNSVDMIYLDFQKAFDTVSHLRLITKLKAYGIEGNLLRWIKNFLHCRKRRVVLNGKHSDWVYVTSGNPQGSVLGRMEGNIRQNSIGLHDILICDYYKLMCYYKLICFLSYILHEYYI